jgi:hypothetical protein
MPTARVRDAAAGVADPCRACPWLTRNQGTRHPDGWYTKGNLARLWAGLRRGEGMSCHQTDPRNPVSPKAAAAGYRPAPDSAEVRECIGGLILQQRELHLYGRLLDLAAYRRARPRGLTRDGLATVVSRLAFGDTCLGGPAMARPNLNHPDVGHTPLPWTPITETNGANQ